MGRMAKLVAKQMVAKKIVTKRIVTTQPSGQTRGRRGGPAMLGALVLAAFAAGGAARARASERPAMGRSVPHLFAASGRAPLRSSGGEIPALIEEHRVDLSGTFAAGPQLGHFLSPALRRVVRLERITAERASAPTVTQRAFFEPGFPGRPELEFSTPLRVPTRLGTSQGSLWTGLSEVRGSAGNLLGVFGRTLFTSPELVESEAFWIDGAGGVHPLTPARYREALREHDTVVIAGTSGDFAALVERTHFPAAALPAEHWFSRQQEPTTWVDREGQRWGVSTETRGRAAAGKGASAGSPRKTQRLRFQGLDGAERAIALPEGWVELRTRLFALQEAEGGARQQAALAPTVADWRFVLQPDAAGSGLLVPLPASGFGVTVPAHQAEERGPRASSAGGGRRERSAGGVVPGLAPEAVSRVLAGF
ncbi:MAG: hypothetical protein IPL40_08340 [Proteobacteria bacterium]|nr:hypothetical protein [Pseudomonadota bacterium]